MSFDLTVSMQRNPPFAKTAAEAKAMRELRREQKQKQAPKGVEVHLSHIRLIPLRPDWRRLPSGRQLNAAIPDPVDVAPPEWAGDRGVLTKAGRVYDYETAHVMRDFSSTGGVTETAGDW